ncbi:PREDICTED: mediator of RNA polymerase II transcription subunit 15-like [Polistes canadensis]|uniref:mediator of RNA polymerase II transcription subunit 15-like n=1 Tax=Polistes canadensis TaxID=91411 RepID=UPI000718DC7C|nr:PREDICTED: mediator of RNA polymerase II transcription subunit 15-like [Polistes canadensis]
MKVFASIILLASVVLAEPPFYRQQQNRQYYFARQQEEAPAAPYAPSNWKPAGPAFNLPQRQVENPQQKYGPPAALPQQQYGAPAKPQQQYGTPNEPQRKYGPPATPQQQYGSPSEPQRQYGTPQQQYGPPPQEPTTTEVPNTTELDDATTVSGITESESEPVNAVNELEEDDLDQKQPQQTGEYYIALPDGRLQRVRYVSRQDVEAMKYFAKIRAENVEPLRGPIYAYAPLQKLQIVPAGLQIALASPVVSPAVEASQPEKIKIEPAKLEIEPVAAQVQYQYDTPSAVLPLPSSPLSSSYAAYTGNYQIPENRYILSVQ